MADKLRLMCVVAHPDDESLGMGAALAKYAAEGVEISILSATRGERGWGRDERDYPGPEALGKIREGELRAAAGVLGAREVHFLDFMDGELDRADPGQAVGRIVSHLRRFRPQVAVTFGPEGSYGHPDHIAICQLTHAAVVRAADREYSPRGDSTQPFPGHSVIKLYYMVDSKDLIREYESVVGRMGMEVEGKMRYTVPWEDWAINTWVDVGAHVETMWQAIRCHASQRHDYEAFLEVPEAEKQRIFGLQSFYRVYSLIDTGSGAEQDLFAGLR